MKVSFIVPVYNAEMYLEECVESIRNQSYADLQIILVDDGSTDGSLNKCLALKDRDSRIEVVQQENKGVSAARNAGLEKAEGEWIAFVDADDFITKYYVEIFKEYLNEKYDICCGDEQKTGKQLPERRENLELNREQLEQYERGLLNKYAVSKAPHLTSACGKLYRRSLLDKKNIRFPEDLKKSEDAFFNQMVFHYATRGVYINREIYCYRQHEDSASHKYDCSSVDNYVKHLELLKHFLSEEGIYKKMEPDYQIRIVYHFFYCVATYYCHKDNFAHYRLRKKEFLTKRETSPFADAFAVVDAAGFSLRERILFYCIKYKCFGL